MDADLNKGAGGEYSYLGFKQGNEGDGITSLKFEAYDKAYNTNPEKGDWFWYPLNLNAKGGKFIYAFWKKEKNQDPIKTIIIRANDQKKQLPIYSWVSTYQDLNQGASGDYIWCYYSKIVDTEHFLASLEYLNAIAPPEGVIELLDVATDYIPVANVLKNGILAVYEASQGHNEDTAKRAIKMTGSVVGSFVFFAGGGALSVTATNFATGQIASMASKYGFSGTFANNIRGIKIEEKILIVSNILVEWQKYFQNESQRYDVYLVAGKKNNASSVFVCFVQSGYNLEINKEIGSSFQYGMVHDKFFTVLHNKDNKPYQFRFAEAAIPALKGEFLLPRGFREETSFRKYMGEDLRDI